MLTARKRLIAVTSALVFGGATCIGLLHCSWNEDTSVTIVKTCDLNQLDVSKAPLQAVKLYVETARDLNTRAQGLSNRFKDVCNAINRDLGQPEGPDVKAACNTVAIRVTAALKRAPVPDAGAPPLWVSVLFDDSSCFEDATAEAACSTQCTGGMACDVASACPPDLTAGSCQGGCTGACSATGTDVPCFGECRGQCALPREGGTPCLAGECIGSCTAPWTGRCTGACDVKFRGTCGGTCTGTCDGNPIGTPPDPDAGDAGPPQAPTGADGNCTGGLCVGQCSASGSGSCGSPCKGDFSGGTCAACTGQCESKSNGCLTTCTGLCNTSVEAGACPGTCHMGCMGTIASPSCEGEMSCKSDPVCKTICRAKGAIAAKCGIPAGLDVRVAGDFALYTALKKNAAEFAAATVDAALFTTIGVNMANLTTGTFAQLGATGEVVRACVPVGSDEAEKARISVAEALSASGVLRGTQF